MNILNKAPTCSSNNLQSVYIESLKEAQASIGNKDSAEQVSSIDLTYTKYITVSQSII